MRRLALASALAFLLIVSCEAQVSSLHSAFQFDARTAGPGQSLSPGMLLKVQVVGPPKDANLSPYLAVLVAVVKRNWYALMPRSALRGKEGEVKIRFKVSGDGSIVANSPKIEWCSGSRSLDKAALEALNSSTDLPQFPPNVPAKQLDLRLIFLCNRDHEY